MFNPAKISALKGIVGWRQPFNPDFAILDATNLASRSGYFVDDNPMAKIETLKASQDFSDISDANFNILLQNMQESSINNVCNAVFNDIVYIDKQVLFKNASKKVNTVTLPDGFVGYEVKVTSQKNVAFEIKRVLLDFQGGGDIELLLFNTAQESSPIFSKIINITSTHQAEDLSWVVDNSGDTYKGDYYFGYLSNYVDIGTLKPFERDFELGNVQSIITGMSLEKGFFSGLSTNTLPDLEDWDGLSEDVGLNPDITVHEDFTELIINNERLFARAIQIDMQIAVLREILSSIRSNKDQRRGDFNALRLIQEINGANGDEFRIPGLVPALNGYISTIKKEFKKLKSGYLPTGITVTTIT